MPDFGTAVTEVRILKWLVEEGQAVARGTLLAEVETDKAASELECVAEGVLLKVCVPEGAAVEAGHVIAYVGAPGEAVPEARAPEAPRVSPVVANLAAKQGVNLNRVKGTGAGGMITREDVMRAGREPQRDRQAAVAAAVTKSNAEIPHLRVAVTIDMSAVERMRAAGRISYDAIFLKAMAGAAKAVTFAGAPQAVHIAVAVSSGNDLLLAVVPDVERKPLDALQDEVEDLAARARQGALRIEEMTGARMALSNLGMYPVDWFEAIVFPGHSAILALGAVAPRPVVCDGRVEVRPTVTAVLAADHRSVNGRAAAMYMTRLKEIIEAGTLA
jgi:pyruvate dehydrogenase E2 component (dihydrolipoamide acetyltransferase)